jgi:hypothetical protein
MVGGADLTLPHLGLKRLRPAEPAESGLGAEAADRAIHFKNKHSYFSQNAKNEQLRQSLPEADSRCSNPNCSDALCAPPLQQKNRSALNYFEFNIIFAN